MANWPSVGVGFGDYVGPSPTTVTLNFKVGGTVTPSCSSASTSPPSAPQYGSSSDPQLLPDSSQFWSAYLGFDWY